jgi:hypothetical protein
MKAVYRVLAAERQADRHGYFGHAVQSILFERR